MRRPPGSTLFPYATLFQSDREIVFSVSGLDVYYGTAHAVAGVALDIGANEVTAIIGPSGCGKSTLLRCFNRMNDLVPDAQDRKSTRLNSSHANISYAVFCL